jgi:hypothetical protein
MDFLRTLYNIPPSQDNLPDYLLLWNPVHGSHWTKNITEAELYAQKIQNDVYFQVALSHNTHGSKRRNAAKESEKRPISYFPALFVDIDMQSSKSNGKKYPKDFDECKLIYDLPGIEPTIVNTSGNGIHAYWCFTEPILLDTQQKREDMSSVLSRFKYFLQNHASQFGFDIDAVQDLVRVLRFPGTINTKNQENKECKTLEVSGKRYNLEDILAFLPAQLPLMVPQTQRTYNNPGPDIVEGEIIDDEMKQLVFDPRAMPPTDKLNILMINDSDFSLLYNHHCIHNMGDRSDSGFDFQLSRCAFYAKWTMQEVANLLISFRRKHSKNIQKALRKDYMYATLSRARAEVQKELSFEFIDRATASKGNEYDLQVKTNEDAKRQAIKCLSDLHGFTIKDILCFRNDNDDARYEIHTSQGVVNIPSSTDFLNANKLKIHVARDIKTIMKIKPKLWDRSAQLMLDITTEVTQTDQARISTAMPGILVEFFKNAREVTELDSVVMQRMPFIYKGEYVFFLDRFIESVRTQYNSMNLGRDKILRALVEAGCYNKNIKINDYPMRLWFVPKRIFDDIKIDDWN